MHARPSHRAAAGQYGPRMTGISVEELQLAACNHGMPLEALRHDVTPPGLPHLLVHYHIPAPAPAAGRRRVTGCRARKLDLCLDDLRGRDAARVRVPLEGAGTARARLEPRPVSQPWLLEAV